MTTTAGTKDASATKMHGLRTNVLGLPSLFAQSVALISPTMTAVLIIPLAFASASQGTWLAYAFGTVMLLFVGWSMLPSFKLTNKLYMQLSARST